MTDIREVDLGGIAGGSSYSALTSWPALTTLLVSIGLALVVILPVIAIAQPWSETSEWTAYLLVGTLYPALGYTLCRRRLIRKKARIAVQGVLVFVALLAGVIFVGLGTSWALAISELFPIIWLARRQSLAVNSELHLQVHERIPRWRVLAALTAMAMLWQAAV